MSFVHHGFRARVDRPKARETLLCRRDARHHTRDGYAPQAAPMALGNT